MSAISQAIDKFGVPGMLASAAVLVLLFLAFKGNGKGGNDKSSGGTTPTPPTSNT